MRRPHAERDRLSAESPSQRSLPQSWGTKHRPEDGSWAPADLRGAAEAMGGMAGRTLLHPLTRAELADRSRVVSPGVAPTMRRGFLLGGRAGQC